MEFVLKRIAKRPNYTIGKLYIASPSPHPEQNSPSRSLPEGGGVDVRNVGQTGTQGTPLSNQTSLPLGGLGRASDWGEPLCDTLEPTWRDYEHGAYKMKGRSAIPEGRYPVVITWSEKFKQWLPILVGVPMFEGIRIHAGNTVKDTTGCILVGENKEKGKVLNSTHWVNRVKDLIVEAKEKGEGVWIIIR